MSSDESLKTSRVVPEVRKEVIPGTVLQQRYRLQRLLDSGGMGQAWLATDATRIVGGSAAQVVIKLLPFALRWNESAAQDFAREYGRVWLLSHPHICKLFDMGQDPQVGSFQVMQFLSGVTIRQLQQQHPGGLDRAVALRIVAACADGLDYAHQQKVIHRDVKPENVMYDPATGTVHLIDFGLAAEIRESLSRYSQGFVAQAGTERYMSPEQWLGQLQNAGCDQWSLGVMAWELLTGAAPYHGSGMTLGFAVCQAPVPKLPSQLSVLQPVFERVLQKQACDRYGTCREFVEELTGLLQPRAVPVSQPVSQRVQPVTRPGLLSAPFSGSAAASAQAAWGNFLGRSVQWQDEFGHDLRLIPAGEFTMGHNESLATLQQAGFVVPPQGDWEAQMKHEGPPHRVQLTRPFYLGAGPVTRGQFAEFVRVTGYRTEAETDGKGGWGYIPATKSAEQRPEFTWRKTGFDQTDAHPVVNVSWNDAQAYLQWLNERSRSSSWVRRYRLPSEAEWEYSCRAGTTTRFHTGDDLASLQGFANVVDASFAKAFPTVDYQKWQKFEFDDGHAFTSVPGAFSCNGFGLYDMHGNVWDWCSDWYDGNYYGKSPVADPPGPASGSSRVLRGGGWNGGPIPLRSCYRDCRTPGRRDYDGGLRVLCELE